MLTAKTQYSLKNAKGYFQEHLAVGDYYQEGQKVAGQWFVEGAGALGLSGRVGEDEFLALCDNVNPKTGKRLTLRLNQSRADAGRPKANRRILYDFTFSPPKSVSLAALLTPDARVVESHHRAVGVALRELERFSATRVRKKWARDLRLTGNVVAARFTHDTARALDPHLHTHVIVFNATFDGSEKRWQALKNYEMETIGWAEEHLFDRRSVVIEAEIWQCALEHARGRSID